MACLPVTLALAAVTIAGFKVEAGADAIFVNWETASEIGNLGFYVLRSEYEAGTYDLLPLGTPSAQFIPSDDFGVGAFYEFIDVQVTPGIRYYYKVQDIPASGAAETVGPESAMIPLPVAATPTATSSPTPTSVSPAEPTATPVATVLFWADPETVRAGECTTIRWQVEQVRAVFFDGAPVAGQSAQAVCPCEPQTHALRVQYRDGGFEDFWLTIGVTGECSDAGTGSSPLPTPPAPVATPRTVPTPVQVAPVSGSTPHALSPIATPVEARDSAPIHTSPIETPSPGPPGHAGGAAADQGVENASGPTPTASPQVFGAVEAQPRTRFPLGAVWLVFAAVIGTGMVGGGIWLWKRS